MKRIALILISLSLGLQSLSALDLSLNDYMNMVEESNKDLYMADIDTKLAETQKKLARSQALPMVSASAGYTRNLLEITTPYAIGAEAGTNAYGYHDLIYADVPYNSKNDFSVSVGVQQLLFDMSVFQALKASRKYSDMAGTIYEATRQGILTAAKQLYYQCVLLEEVYNVKKETEQNAYETWQDIMMKYENDLASELDVLQAEVNWQINIPESTQAARNRDLALNNMKLLAGIDTSAEVNLTDGLTLGLPEQPAWPEPGSVLSSRPDYVTMQQQVELLEINKDAEKATFYPSLSATLGYGWQASNDEFSFDDGTNALQAGLELTIPIFYGGSRFAKLEEAKLNLEQSKVDLLKKQDEILSEISNLQLLLAESSSRLVSAEKTRETADRAYRIMEISARNGMATQLDLKDARLSQSNATLNYYSAV
ncbi:MAG: TolC family protein, partial [Spirochaetales bacterium]|nr:TolC family protein [Spirochaetales bacterium]